MEQKTVMKKKKYSLLFLTINSSYSHSSLSLPLLHSASRSFDDIWHWEGMEEITGEDPAFIASAVAEKSPDLLCTALYLFNHNIVMDILQRVHRIAPHIHIAAGGPECTQENGAFLLKKYPFLSTVFIGEGEEEFRDFLVKFPERKDKKNILPESGRAIYENWASSPFACEDPFFRFDKPFVQVETSRGCPMNCSYCTSSGVPTRYRELSQVKEELLLLQKKGVKEIRILDRSFNLPQKRGKELLELFTSFPSMRFHLEFHPEFTGEDLRTTLQNMPCNLLHIEAGVQSFDEKVQNAVGRKSDCAKVKENLRFLASLDNFEVHTDLIAGLPEQTKESLLSDIVALMKIAPAEIQLETLKILPGTRMEKETQKYGICYSGYPPYDVMKTSCMSASELLEMRLFSRLLDLFYNHKALHTVMVEIVKREEKILEKMAERLREEKRGADSLLDLKKRFLFLVDFLEDKEKFEYTAFLLACAWLEAGFPLSAVPAKNLQNLEKLPEDAQFLYGNILCKEKRETKFYLLSSVKESRIFAFNRAYSMNRPSAVWKISGTM